jgi:transposase
MIRTMLEYKCQLYGSTLVVVRPLTPETCSSACGVFDAATRTTPVRYVSSPCGGDVDADINAARGVLAIGPSTGGLPGMACGSSQTIGGKQEKDARENVEVRRSFLLGPIRINTGAFAQ